jgi:hypothetical protein
MKGIETQLLLPDFDLYWQPHHASSTQTSTSSQVTNEARKYRSKRKPGSDTKIGLVRFDDTVQQRGLCSPVHYLKVAIGPLRYREECCRKRYCESFSRSRYTQFCHHSYTKVGVTFGYNFF